MTEQPRPSHRWEDTKKQRANGQKPRALRYPQPPMPPREPRHLDPYTAEMPTVPKEPKHHALPTTGIPKINQQREQYPPRPSLPPDVPPPPWWRRVWYWLSGS